MPSVRHRWPSAANHPAVARLAANTRAYAWARLHTAQNPHATMLSEKGWCNTLNGPMNSANTVPSHTMHARPRQLIAAWVVEEFRPVDGKGVDMRTYRHRPCKDIEPRR
jgi:hypothetical protein